MMLVAVKKKKRCGKDPAWLDWKSDGLKNKEGNKQRQTQYSLLITVVVVSVRLSAASRAPLPLYSLSVLLRLASLADVLTISNSYLNDRLFPPFALLRNTCTGSGHRLRLGAQCDVHRWNLVFGKSKRRHWRSQYFR